MKPEAPAKFRLEFDGTLTADEQQRALRIIGKNFAKTAAFRQLRFRFLICWVALILVIFVIAMYYSSPVVAFCLLLLPLAFCVFLAQCYKIQLRTVVAEDNLISGLITDAEIQASFMTSDRELMVMHVFSWKRFKGFQESKSFFLLQFKNWLMIPKRIFSPVECDQLREFLAGLPMSNPSAKSCTH